MTYSIGVRELKTHASRVLRAVRDEMTEYVITLRGRPIAMLKPLTDEDEQRLRRNEITESLADMKSLSRAVAESWMSDQSGLDLVTEQRR